MQSMTAQEGTHHMSNLFLANVLRGIADRLDAIDAELGPIHKPDGKAHEFMIELPHTLSRSGEYFTSEQMSIRIDGEEYRLHLAAEQIEGEFEMLKTSPEDLGLTS